MSSTNGNELASGLPPWHSIAAIGLIAAVFFRILPSMSSVDEVATLETFSKRLFPNLISLKTLTFIRASICLFIFGVSLYSVVGGGFDQITTYKPDSKLKKGVTIHMHGIRTQMPFTSWSWNLLGLSFGLNAYIAYCVLSKTLVPVWLLRVALLVFETAAPNTLLVSFVIRYAIWPQVLRGGKGPDPTIELRSIRTLLWHNANVIFALVEVSLLGGLPVQLKDFAVAPFFGIAYAMFAYASMNYWVPGAGPQFLYWFFDTTLGWTHTIAILILLMALMSFYGVFAVLHKILDRLGGGPMVHGMAVVLMSSLVCRFRD